MRDHLVMRTVILISVIFLSALSLSAAKGTKPKPTFVPDNPVERKKMGADFSAPFKNQSKI